MTRNKAQRTLVTISNAQLAVVRGGGRHAERTAFDTASSAGWCDSITMNLPYGAGTVTITGCTDGSGSATYTPPGGGGGDGGPHIS